MTPRHFAWQAWHLATSTFVLRGRLGSVFVDGDAAALCVAGVAHGDIYLRFAWQAWYSVTSTFVFRGRRGTYGTGWRAWVGFSRWRRGTLRHFAWQAWDLATSTFVLRGTRGTWPHPPSFCVASVALMALGWLWCGPVLVAGDAAALCVAGVALGDIHRRFTWQVWHLETSTFVLRGRRGTIFDTPAFTHHLSHTIFHTQLCHPPSFTHHLSHTPLCHPTSLTYHLSHTISHPTLSPTIFHAPSFTHRFVTHHLWHTIFHTPSFTHNFVTLNFVTHHLSHTTLSATIFDTPSFTHTQLCHTHTIFDTPSFTHHLCNTPSFTHHPSHTFTPNFVKHHLWHTIFDTPLCHTPLCLTPSFTTPSSTHHFHHTIFSHTTLSHALFHTELSHTPSFTTPSFTHLHTPLCHTPLCLTPSFITPSSTHHLSPQHFSHTTLSHTIFDTPSFTHHFLTHHLSHTTLSHTIFHTQLCHTLSCVHNFHTQLSHTPSFTHCFVTHTHHLSSSHTIFHTQLCHTHTHHLSHTTLSHTTLFYFSVLHHRLCLSFFPRPRYNMWCSFLEEVALWGYPVLYFFGFWFCLAIAEETKNEAEHKKPENQGTKKPKIKKNKIAHPKGGSSGRELGLVILFFLFFFCFFCFLVSWFLVLFSHCRKTKQKFSMVAKQWENHGTCAVSVVAECNEKPHSQGVPFCTIHIRTSHNWEVLEIIMQTMQTAQWR